MTTVRRMEEHDADAVLAMARAMAAESPRYRESDFDEAKVRGLLRFLIDGQQGVAFVADDGGRLVGMMGGFLTPHFFGQDCVASDFALFVEPERRGTSCAFRLLRAFEEWAEDRGAREIVLGVSTEVHAERTASMYERMGYRRSGISMLRRLDHV